MDVDYRPRMDVPHTDLLAHWGAETNIRWLIAHSEPAVAMPGKGRMARILQFQRSQKRTLFLNGGAESASLTRPAEAERRP